MKHLILGGARSGKSRHALQLALHAGGEVRFLATAVAHDDEMRERIAIHRRERPRHWITVEVGDDLAGALAAHAAPGRTVIVDCLTLWLATLLCGDDPATPPQGDFARRRDALLNALPALPGRVLLVSNELGLGVVPLGALTRRFCDEAGRLHQAVAARCERVTLMVAGLPLVLKSPLP